MVVWVGVFNISFASAAEEDFYGWQSFTLAGDMRKVSPRLDKVRWNVMSQTRLGNNHKDLTEYLVSPEKVSLTLLEFWVDPILQTALLSLTNNKSGTKMRSSIFVGSRLSQPSVD